MAHTKVPRHSGLEILQACLLAASSHRTDTDLEKGAWRKGRNVTLPDPLRMCIVTMNAPMYERAEFVASQLESKCQGAHVVAIASQELTTWKSSIFQKFKQRLHEKALSNYTLVGECSNQSTSISAGVFLLVKSELQSPFGYENGTCAEKGPSFLGWGFLPGAKGTAILKVDYAGGTLVVASTHGTRAGTASEDRVTHFMMAARAIAQAKPTHLAWAGDFNSRTYFNRDSNETLRFGLTHPPGGSSCPHRCDRSESWLEDFSPYRAFQELQKKKDYFGGAKDNLLTFDDITERVREETRVPLFELDGSHLCPTYYKARDRGKLVESGWTTIRWSPTFACKACQTCDEEYYRVSLDGKGKDTWEGDRNRAPSRTERIFVAGAMKCAEIEKIPAWTDHDALVAVCDLTFE
eukprot:CAMPEP_0171093434 /NCGR_PEP_ID=MMETSP0766_2-20121228/39075_1 /TAXON_ID=439317 /ORGANISM="Gambierdiscus australes, Strain CAWD 149" /LENGTH=407 /DNA_ID=CAMNT_0011551883 /DNA_START=47 /DNA_END=1270 /DNA_ORIENTATION=+